MKVFKKVVSAVLVGTMAISFAACSGEVSKKDRKHKDRDNSKVASIAGYKQYSEDEFIDIVTEVWEKDKDGVIYSEPEDDEDYGYVKIKYNDDINAILLTFKDEASASDAFKYKYDKLTTEIEENDLHGSAEYEFDGYSGYITIYGNLKGYSDFFWSPGLKYYVYVLSGNTIVAIETGGSSYREKKVEIVNKLAEALDYPQLPAYDQ